MDLQVGWLAAGTGPSDPMHNPVAAPTREGGVVAAKSGKEMDQPVFMDSRTGRCLLYTLNANGVRRPLSRIFDIPPEPIQFVSFMGKAEDRRRFRRLVTPKRSQTPSDLGTPTFSEWKRFRDPCS